MSEPFIPKPYQIDGRDHIVSNDRCALWFPMGMGKTTSTLSALNDLSLVEDIYPTLVLAPYRVANVVWPGETEKWKEFSNISVSPVLGDAQERKRALKVDANIFSINYENIPWLIEQKEDWPFKTVIADESTRLKSFRSRQGGKRARALSTILPHTKRWINLTGTPSPRGLTDLWGQTFFLDKGERLGRTYVAFEQRWFRRGWDGFSLEPMPHAQKEIEEKLSDICLSVDPKDYFDLKEPIETTMYVDLPHSARKLYNEMEKRMFIEIEREPIEAFNAAAKTNACSQLANGAIYSQFSDPNLNDREWKTVHNVKIDALESIIAELAGAPLLVAYHFKSDLARLKTAFPQGRVFDKNPKTEDEWNAGEIPLLFAHPMSAGHGSNLQLGGHHIAYFALDWNLEGFLQILERLGPMRQLQSGLDRNVFIYYIVAKNTIDEDKLTRLRTRESVQSVLMKAMKRRKL